MTHVAQDVARKRRAKACEDDSPSAPMTTPAIANTAAISAVALSEPAFARFPRPRWNSVRAERTAAQRRKNNSAAAPVGFQQGEGQANDRPRGNDGEDEREGAKSRAKALTVIGIPGHNPGENLLADEARAMPGPGGVAHFLGPLSGDDFRSHSSASLGKRR